MAEPVRLVIWDLDDTFWRGTISEGGMSEYVQHHHDLIIELARRGIMSSICSKNNFADVEAILKEKGLWDYFIFPSIDWSPKGGRVAALVDTVQLRAPTVLFIDDNPGNRGEVAERVPGVQVADETIIPHLLDDPRFKGKDDAGLTRLAQYKLLERRKSDELQAGDDNSDFLRGCNIEVMIETDIEAHLDRAIELINRTNQLNFTKLRLPEDRDEARIALRDGMNKHQHKVGIVRVRDKYGDYGYCGFYAEFGPEGDNNLYHYCFSCRILGMGVETWLYQRLGRPAIRIVGEVLTDLSKPVEIDWIRLVDTFDGGQQVQDQADATKAFYVRGGCDLDPLAHYLRVKFGSVIAETNVTENGIWKRFDSSVNLLSANAAADPDAAAREFAKLDMPIEEFRAKLFDGDVPPGTSFLVSTWADSQGSVYRHKQSGVEVCYVINGFMRDLTTIADADLEAHLDSGVSEATLRERIRSAVDHLRAHYTHRWGVGEDGLKQNIRRICEAVPTGCTLFLMLQNPTEWRDGALATRPGVERYNRWVKEAAAAMAHIRLIEVDDFIESPEEISHDSGDHFHRKVYYRLYQEVLRLA